MLFRAGKKLSTLFDYDDKVEIRRVQDIKRILQTRRGRAFYTSINWLEWGLCLLSDIIARTVATFATKRIKSLTIRSGDTSMGTLLSPWLVVDSCYNTAKRPNCNSANKIHKTVYWLLNLSQIRLGPVNWVTIRARVDIKSDRKLLVGP